MFIIFSIFISYLLLIVGLKLSVNIVDFEKLSAYECGFLPIGDARQPFHVRFYLVGILFLLFDLEVMFLFPWVLFIQYIVYSLTMVVTCCLFVIILFIGIFYEWRKGVLNWE